MRMMTAAFLGALSFAPGAALAGPSALYAFGDSLSDAGNAYIATSGAQPGGSYGFVNGYQVFSDGPVWVQDLAQRLGLGTLSPSLAGGTDFAVGGAQSGSYGTLGGYAYTAQPGDLPSQLAAFQAATPHPARNALYTLSIGSNDFDNIFSHETNPLFVQNDLGQVLGNIVGFVAALVGDGAKDFAILNVPDLGQTPAGRASGHGPQLSAAALSFDQALAAQLSGLAATDGVAIHVIDTYALVDKAVSDPAYFGLTNSTVPCMTDPATCGTSLFFSSLHPTAAGHAILADYALAAVPEPATAPLLAGGVAMMALGLARGRRKAAAQ